jgi:modification methylase
MTSHTAETAKAAVAHRMLEPWLNKVTHGDCLEVMAAMPEHSVDIIVTSPPYNLLNSTGSGMKGKGGGRWKSAALVKGYDQHDDKMPYEKYVNWQRECLRAMFRLLTDDGAIYYNHKWRVQNGLLQDRHEIVEGFPVRQLIIWQRSGGFNFNLQYFLPTYEVIYLICKPAFRLRSVEAGDYGDVWKIPQARDNGHPAPFPVEIPRRCIKTTGANIVLDPFLGSGTTAVAAKLMGIDWVGIEKSQKYCELAEKRLSSLVHVVAENQPLAEKEEEYGDAV